MLDLSKSWDLNEVTIDDLQISWEHGTDSSNKFPAIVDSVVCKTDLVCTPNAKQFELTLARGIMAASFFSPNLQVTECLF